MTIAKALRKLYKAIVGSDAPVGANSITKLIVALADNWPSDSSSDS